MATSKAVAKAPKHDLVIPSDIDELCEQADTSQNIAFQHHWYTASLVYAATEPQSGKRTDLAQNCARLSLDEFAKRGVRGLGSRNTVAKYRAAMKWAIDNGHCKEPVMGKRFQLPVIDFGEANETRHNVLTGNYEWYTPKLYVEASRTVMGSIDTDPASSAAANKIVRADKFFTEKQNGLTKKWTGNVFLNPPYKQPEVALFTNKLWNDYMLGEIKQAILLTNNSTDTTWWQDAAQHCLLICFTSSRISFENKDGEQKNAPTTGQTFMYFGNRIEKFKKVFSDIGWIGSAR